MRVDGEVDEDAQRLQLDAPLRVIENLTKQRAEINLMVPRFYTQDSVPVW